MSLSNPAGVNPPSAPSVPMTTKFKGMSSDQANKEAGASGKAPQSGKK